MLVFYCLVREMTKPASAPVDADKAFPDDDDDDDVGGGGTAAP